MSTTANSQSLLFNPFIRVFREIRLPLLGLPVVGYAIGGGLVGGLYGTAILGGIWLGYGAIALNLRWRTRAFRKERMKSYCPVCLSPFEGRQACPGCGKELPAVACVPGTRLIRHCPACGKAFEKGPDKPQDRCFSGTCSSESDPVRLKWIENFAGKIVHYRIALINHPWEPGKNWAAINQSDGRQRYVQTGTTHAIVLDVMESRGFGGEGGSARVHAIINEAWVHSGAPVNALQALKQIRPERGFRLNFEASKAEIGTDAHGFSEIKCGISLSDWLREAEEIIARNGKR